MTDPESTSATSAPGPRPALEACGYSHPGQQREENEDAFGIFLDERLFVLADGMGGRAAGQVAAHMAVDELVAFVRARQEDERAPWPFAIDQDGSLGTNLLRNGLKLCNQKIREAAASDRSLHRMAATCATLMVGDTHLIVGHVGDVRLYRYRDRCLERLTRDHSVLEEMLAVRPNMSQAEVEGFAHRNVVTKSLGSKEEVEPGVATLPFAAGDVYLLCCDGLWGSVKDEAIRAILAAVPDLDEACMTFIDAANDAGGPDNITAVLIRVG